MAEFEQQIEECVQGLRVPQLGAACQKPTARLVQPVVENLHQSVELTAIDGKGCAGGPCNRLDGVPSIGRQTAPDSLSQDSRSEGVCLGQQDEEISVVVQGQEIGRPKRAGDDSGL